jgi:hypothetical protein
MKIFVALVKTESCDTYTWLYRNEPSRADVIQRLWQYEQAEELSWYEETTSVHITEEEVTE